MARAPTSQYAPVQPAVQRANHEDRHLPNGPDELNWSGAIHMSGTAAARPTAGATNKGCLYFATDSGIMYRSDGATWTQVGISTGGGAPTGAAGGALDGTYPNPGLAASVAGAGLTETTDVLSVNATAPLGITSDAVAFNTGYRAGFSGTAAPTTPTPAKGDYWFDTTNNLEKVYNGTVWITLTPQSATTAGGESRTSATYGDLSGGATGPAVTVATGTAVIITTSVFATAAAADEAYLAVAVSGATTLAAGASTESYGRTQNDSHYGSISNTFKLTGLTAGSNTFTCKYAGGSGIATIFFYDRSITVQAVPT